MAADPTLEDGSTALHITAALGASSGGRETLGIRIDGVPAGASLSAGARDSETGAWVLRPDELTGLRLIPPADFAGTLSLHVTAVAAEATGDSASISSPLAVAVEAVADEVLISAAPAIAVEDTAVPLNLSILPGDSDGSETVIAVLLSSLSPGCRIADGPGITDHGNGTWSVAPDHLDQVRLIPPPHAHGSFSLTVTATVQEASNDETRSTSRPVAVTVEASPDAPVLAASDAVGWEDRVIALDISAALVDQDGSEVLSIVLSGLPQGSQLSAGVNNGDGSWTLKRGDLAGLVLVPPGNWSGDMALAATALVVERSTGATASTTAGFHVHVGGVADMPFVDAAVTGTGAEDQALPIDIRAQLTDQDGSEHLQLAVSGVPAGGRFSAGSLNADGSWTIPGSALSGLTFTPPANYAGTLRLDCAVMAIEADGATASRPISITLTVTPVADAPILTLGSAQGDEDTAIRLPISAALSDTDGSEQLLRVEIAGVPAGATLSAGTRASNGSWTLLPAQLADLTLTPPANYSGRLTLSVTAISAEAATGMEAATQASLGVDITPVADAAIVTAPAANGAEDTALLLNLTVALGDTDGSEVISAIRMIGLPTGFSLSAGHALGGGVWELARTDLPGLRLTPAPDWNGTTTLSLEVTSREVATGATITTAKPFAVSLVAMNDAPVLTLVPAGDPAAVGTAETPAFAGVTATDKDSAMLAGATVTLTGGASGDTLDIGGFSLHTVGGKTMIGSTGIEIVGGGYDSVTGSLTLRGAASPATYTAVLQGLALENTGSAGLAAGTRTIGVTVQDDQGAMTAHQTVALAVQSSLLQGDGHDQVLNGTAGHDTVIGSAGAETMLGGAGADLFVLMPGGGHDVIDGGSGSWVDAIQVSNAGAPGAGNWVLVVDTAGATATPEAHAVAFDQPVSGHIQFADGTQAEFTQIERVTW